MHPHHDRRVRDDLIEHLFALMADLPDTPTLAEAKAIIALLTPNDRAFLRPWLLAVYDVRGYERPR